MPAAASKSTRPAIAMRPASGLSSPASMLTRVVLPAPDRPKRARTPVAGSAALAVKLKPPRRFSTEISSIAPLAADARMDAPRQRLRSDEGGKRQDQRDDRKPEGGKVALGLLGQGIDGDGDRAGLA